MGDTWGADGPPEAAYSRVTRDLDAVLTGLHDVARGMVEDPAEPACLPGAVALLGCWDVLVRHTWFEDAPGGPVMCT